MGMSYKTKRGNIDVYNCKNPVIAEIVKSVSELRIIDANMDETSDDEILEYLILKHKMIMAGYRRLIKQAKDEGIASDIPPIYFFQR